ncbi:MAG: hypothetical protein QM747_19260 [Nocardioides sp.]
MTRLVVDPAAFVAMARSDVAPRSSHQLVAPNSLRTRALELLLPEVRSGALDAREALKLHERLTETKVRLLEDRVSRRTAWDLAVEHGWTDLRDAEYIAVAMLQADALIALDGALVAKATGIVATAPLEVCTREGEWIRLVLEPSAVASRPPEPDSTDPEGQLDGPGGPTRRTRRANSTRAVRV